LVRMALRPGFTNPPEAAALELDPSLAFDESVECLRGQIQRIQNGEQMTQECSLEGRIRTRSGFKFTCDMRSYI
jgi:hypothetical protein